MTLAALARALPADRRVVRTVLPPLAVLLLCFVVLPDRDGGRGVPLAIVFAGTVFGFVNALTAAGLIVVYRTSRIINFAHTAIGAVGALLVFRFVQYTDVPFPLAFPAGLVLAGVAGAIFDLVFGRRFFRAPRLVLTVVTIAAAGFISGIGPTVVDTFPFFPPPQERAIADLFGTENLRSQLPFPGFEFHVGGFAIPFGFAEVFALEVSVIALLLVADFFRRTRAGIGVRAMSENVERASLLGVSTGNLSTVVWLLAGVLAGAGVTLSGMLTSPSAATGVAPDVLLPALAAAVIGRMRSLPVTVAAAVGIAIVTRSITYSLQDDVALVDLLLFLVVAVGLLVQRRGMTRSEAGEAGSWQASDEPRAVPRELASLNGVRLARRAFVVAAMGVGVGLPFVVSTSIVNLGGVIILNTIVAVSIVVLTGWAGQVSLGQYGFAAVGAVLASAMTTRAGVPFWIAVPVATAATAAFAAAVGLPALRIKGLFLAITTFAFAIAVHAVLFSPRYFGWLLPTQTIKRPRLFVFDFEDERSMYFLCLGALLLAVYFVANMRRSRWGRIFIALRDNEANVQAFGITTVRAKLLAFAVSGGLAGFAGAVFVHQQRTLSTDSFDAQASIDVFILAVIGGVGSVGGALLGAVYMNATRYVVTSDLVTTLLGAGGTLYLLYAAPGGLLALVHRVRDAVLRIVAQRRQLVVPSLFADYDPEALARRLIPLAAPSGEAGLGALPADRRFTLATELYDDEAAYRRAGASTGNGHDAEALRAAAGQVTTNGTHSGGRP